MRGTAAEAVLLEDIEGPGLVAYGRLTRREQAYVGKRWTDDEDEDPDWGWTEVKRRCHRQQADTAFWLTWREPPSVNLTNFEAILKAAYPVDMVANLATRPHPIMALGQTLYADPNVPHNHAYRVRVMGIADWIPEPDPE